MLLDVSHDYTTRHGVIDNGMNKEGAHGPLPPFLKWPGGKRWFIGRHKDVLPQEIKGRYIEPFLGAGAVFFALSPRIAVLNDTNDDLIATYRGVKSDWKAVLARLQEHQTSHNKDYYYAMRSAKPKILVERAARLIYLNRTCFNGIYRVNLQGQFNVPMGTKTAVLLPTDDFAGWSHHLQCATLHCKDFEAIIDQAERGDFIFADPPYTVRHNGNGFIKYNEVLFSWGDQVRLYKALQRAKARGAQILLTNANHDSIRTLYSDGFTQQVVSRFSSISGVGSSRSTFDELIITG